MAMGIFEGTHGQDGRRLQGHPPGGARARRQVQSQRSTTIPHLLQLATSSPTRKWELCPPVVAVGGDGAMYDIGFQNLSRVMASGKPIKVFVVDTQVYSNTGGQACTSGFIGQVSDMAQFGKAIQGKQEPEEGDRPDRDGAPHDVRDAEHHGATRVTHDRRFHPRAEGPAPGALQPLQHLASRSTVLATT